ncbi:hypothetical protein L226DRAFT_586493 [Lentinus tigrinus ALCF2SS1-7]|uniref:BTB domain-containing protein n=1 Tax=Lentinus tigrinus ALCF2SS1-6 TaxID=1328759 RepID=A0A5C2SV88_9APHY|nr:hypothetical protein L227DRAFT_619786 [Lentinus tigrinus ALCF2SS1-6]RPD81295.1 hypothetical protein L226DRAFT_586493 [Lentinus tigrinus ALCF2SS1-7]
MDSVEWDSVFQYIAEPSDFASPQPERPVAEMAGVPVLPQLAHQGQPSDTSSPPEMQDDVPADHVPGNTIVSVSTSFHPGATLLPIPPDIIFLSSDGVFFYVHTTQVLSMSSNRFSGLVPPTPTKTKSVDELGPVVALPENATVLNVVLHAVYEVSCAHYHPSIDTLIAAVDAMAHYGISPKQHISPSTPLYNLILSQAPMQPIVVYALAAAHDLYDLAVPVSSHLLSFTLHSLTDELSLRIGPLYMKRLFFLHLGRLDALKRLLLPPPHPHPPTQRCDFTEQKKLTRAWALASAYLAWDSRPDLSTSAMESALCPLADHLSCDVCKKSLRDRVKQLIGQWSVVKRSI